MGLTEVLIALAIFSIFSLTYMKIQGGSLLDSMQSRHELKLKNLLDQVITEIKMNPPTSDDLSILEMKKETKNFESDQDYEYTIEYKRFEIPNLIDEENSNYNQIFEKVAEKISEILFQVRVSVNKKGETFSLTASTWIHLNDQGVYFDTLVQ